MTYHYDNAEEVMGRLQQLLHGQDLTLIANRTGLSKSALYRIRAGKTKWAKDTTFFCLIHFFGLRMMLVPSNL